MTTDLLIRKASDNDIEELINLLKILFSIEQDFVFDENKQRSGLKMILANKNSCCLLVSELNANIVGMCSAQLIISTAEGGIAALIEDLVVKENYRGQGIGSNLLTSIEKWAAGNGAKRLELLADRSNHPALEFYQRMNWQKTQLVCLHKK